MLSSVSSVFDNLPTRPPTPPKDVSNAIDDAINFLDDSNEIEQNLSSIQRQALRSDDDPPSSPTSFQAACGDVNASKRVGFSPHLKYHKASAIGPQNYPRTRSPKRTPPNHHSRPLRSILKLSSVPPPLTPDDLETRLGYFTPNNPVGFVKMLHSVIQQLAGPSISSRVDAYITLNGSLRAYENVPDQEAMLAKLSLLTQFISRDMPWRQSGDLNDIRLVDHALKLTNALLYDPKISAALDDDFLIFLLDRSIAILEHAEAPKSVIKAHMTTLTQQRFPKSILTSARADKLLTALRTIEERCTGNSVVALRLFIYQRLVERLPAFMASRLRDFLEHVFHGMLSSIKDIRIRAIETCARAASILGVHAQVAKSLEEMFETDVEEGQSYFIYFTLRLTAMISDHETGPYVPQIWSSILLFYRSKGRPLERWSRMKSWLVIIQKCLNASDLNTKYQAHLAWNKFVYAVLPGSSTSRNMFSMLLVPIAAGMHKRGNDKHSRQARQFAFDSYYNLLHYSLRPGLTNDELDSAWDTYIEPVLSKLINDSGRAKYAACRILTGLFTRSSGTWNLDAAQEATPIKPDDLPKLDSRWVRSRLARTFKLMQPMLQGSMWLSIEANIALDQTLRALIDSIAEAGSQEVKTSNELKDAVAMTVEMLRSLWQSAAPPPAEIGGGTWVDRFGSLVGIVVKGIGSAPFTEDILTVTKDDTLEAATTPSHRPSKHQSAPQAPLVILFGLLYQPAASVTVDSNFFGFARDLLDLAIASRATMHSRLDLINRSLQIWSMLPPPSDMCLAGRLWGCTAICAEQVIDLGQTNDEHHGSQHVGHSLRDAAAILIRGIKHAAADEVPMESMLALYRAMSESAAATAGSGGQVLAVFEPLSKAMLADSSLADMEARLVLATQMLNAKCWPRSRQELDQARKALWGVTLAPHKAAAFDPYDHVYRLATDLMLSTYGKLESADLASLDTLLTFMVSCMGFLRACPSSVLAIALRKMQAGFVAWIEDENKITAGRGAITESVIVSWQELLRLLKSLPQQDSTLLKALEPLLVAGFVSPHKTVVNATISFWNDSFGCQTTLEYPARIERVLRARLAETELQLPDFPESAPQDQVIVLPPFYESQEAEHLPDRPTSIAGELSRIAASTTVVKDTQLKAPTPRPIRVSSPISRTSRQPGSSTPKARLRHDDSQIQFAPIDSSPIHLDEQSQHLTERQRDVRDRQLAAGQMYPDLSSSPMPPREPVQKRLNFSTTIGHAHSEANGTPRRLPALDLPMSDDIPSSPTPSSARKSVAHVELDSLGVDADITADPPSSPPSSHHDEDVGRKDSESREAEIGPDTTTIFSTDNTAEEAERGSQLEPDNDAELPEIAGFATSTSDVDMASDLPSDTMLPEAQLREEEEEERDVEAQTITNGGTDKNAGQSHAPADEKDSKVSVKGYPDQAGEAEVTKVGDSFIEKQEDTHSVDGSQQSQRGSGRKRKRQSTKVYTARKRKQQSPFKRIISGIFGRSQEEDDDEEDIGDEIVVASSQLSQSSAGDQAEATEDEDGEQAVGPSASTPEPVASVVKTAEVQAEQPVKRRRGRPRKAGTPIPTPAQPTVAATRSMKRRASAISQFSDAQVEPATSIVKATPAPVKARKQREGSDAKLVREASMSQESLDTSHAAKRAATGVVIPKKRRSDAPDEEESPEDADGIDLEELDPGSQLLGEAAAAVFEPPVTTPKGLIAQLRGSWAALQSMVLGPREEREVDDLLFEIKREVYEAGRRGRG